MQATQVEMPLALPWTSPSCYDRKSDGVICPVVARSIWTWVAIDGYT
ncbi:hypothetical protein [Ktedonosporobacter rubrisoli]|nr:hypothetical protein [Ktedonosporobacter rubrisoli]